MTTVASWATRRQATIGVVLLLALVLLHLSVGRGVDWGAVTGLGPGDAEQSWFVLRVLRLPRALVAVLSGAALGIAGMLLQAVLRNSLASPEMTAINPSAVVAVLLVAATGHLDPADLVPTTAVALVGGIAGGGVMWLIARRCQPETTAVLGLLSSLVLSGVSTLLLASQPVLASNISRWLVGTLTGQVSESAWLLAPVVALGLVLALVCAPALDLVMVGDPHAHGLGVHPGRWRAVGLAVAALLSAGAVATVGPLAFVGLVAPHAARRLGGARLAVVIPLAALVGAVLVVGCDVLASAASIALQGDAGRQLGVPAGAVTCVLGAAVLVLAVLRAPEGATS